jgi:hypothetical protein
LLSGAAALGSLVIVSVGVEPELFNTCNNSLSNAGAVSISGNFNAVGVV